MIHLTSKVLLEEAGTAAAHCNPDNIGALRLLHNLDNVAIYRTLGGWAASMLGSFGAPHT